MQIVQKYKIDLFKKLIEKQLKAHFYGVYPNANCPHMQNKFI